MLLFQIMQHLIAAIWKMKLFQSKTKIELISIIVIDWLLIQ